MEDADATADHKLQMLVLERPDQTSDMARFYVLSIDPALFGDAALTRECDLANLPSRKRSDAHTSLALVAEALESWLARKRSRRHRISA